MLKTWSTPFCSSEYMTKVCGSDWHHPQGHHSTPMLGFSETNTKSLFVGSVDFSKHMEWPFSSPYTNRQNKNSKHSSHHQPPGLTITPFLIRLELDFRSKVLWKAGSWIPAYIHGIRFLVYLFVKHWLLGSPALEIRKHCGPSGAKSLLPGALA